VARKQPRGEWATRLTEGERRELVRSYAIDLLVTLEMEERIAMALAPGANREAVVLEGRILAEKREPAEPTDAEMEALAATYVEAATRAQQDRRRVLATLPADGNTETSVRRELGFIPRPDELRVMPDLDTIEKKWKGRARGYVDALVNAGVLYEHHRKLRDAELIGTYRSLEGWVTGDRDAVLKESEVPGLLVTPNDNGRSDNFRKKTLKEQIGKLKRHLGRPTPTGAVRKSARIEAQIAARKRDLLLIDLHKAHGKHGSKRSIEQKILPIRKLGFIPTLKKLEKEIRKRRNRKRRKPRR